MERDAVVVGAGPNGLAAAIALGQAGWKVTVVEARETVGGAARSAELTIPGVLHDVCSAIYPLTVGSPYLSQLPLERHGLRWIEPPLQLAHPLDDGTAGVLARDFATTGESFGDPADAEAWRELFAPLTDSWDALARDFLGPIKVPHHSFKLARFGLMGLRSAASLAESRFRGLRARALFAGADGGSEERAEEDRRRLADVAQAVDAQGASLSRRRRPAGDIAHPYREKEHGHRDEERRLGGGEGEELAEAGGEGGDETPGGETDSEGEGSEG